MTDMDLNERAAARRRRWRRLSGLVTGSLAVAAVGGAVYLGTTGPLVSPVQPAAAAVSVAEPAQGAVDDDADLTAPVRRGRDESAGFGRTDAAGFGRDR